MKIKVNTYNPNTTILLNTNTSINNTSEGESFEDVLELNQAALKAMTIDAMVAMVQKAKQIQYSQPYLMAIHIFSK